MFGKNDKSMVSLQQSFVLEAEAIKKNNSELKAKSLDKQKALENKIKVEKAQEDHFSTEVEQADVFINNIKGLFVKSK